nr:DUF2007 domain-containing protein [Pseudemcibacter aquimaris]
MLFSDNPVVISRISAMLEAENIEYVVLGGHASLYGVGLEGIQSRMMVDEENHERAVSLIRAENLENVVDLKDG